MNKEYWNDVATKGVILGALMLASHIFEQMSVLSGSMVWMAFMSLEMLIVAAVYIFLIYRFAKKASVKFFQPQTGFSFGQGVLYVWLICVSAGILVGLGSYIHMHFIVGYEAYFDRLYDSLETIIDNSGMPSSIKGVYLQTLEQIGEQPEPNVISSVISTMFSYGLTGCIIGLIIAGFVKREPNPFGNENKSEGEI